MNSDTRTENRSNDQIIASALPALPVSSISQTLTNGAKPPNTRDRDRIADGQAGRAHARGEKLRHERRQRADIERGQNAQRDLHQKQFLDRRLIDHPGQRPDRQ